MPSNFKLLATPDASDTEGHGWRNFTTEGGDEWLDDMLRRQPEEQAPVRISLADDDDTEGHLGGRTPTLRLIVQGDDDTEGHAISVHFPSVEEADRFRRRLLATGVLVGAVALGATTGAILSDRSQAGAPDAGAGTVAAEQVSGEYAADRGVGVAPDVGSSTATERASGEYAADRGAGISPQVAAENDTLDGNPNTDVMPR